MTEPNADAGRTVAAFDFDGTLTRHDSLLPFLARIAGWPRVALAFARVAPRLARASTNSRDRDAAKERLLVRLLAGRQYQYTVGRDAGFQQPRPQNFYGPMVVMQNERSASDAEMFPAGFKALGLGKVVGVPTMGAVIGNRSYTLLDGSAIRTPGSGVWTVDGDNM